MTVSMKAFGILAMAMLLLSSGTFSQQAAATEVTLRSGDIRAGYAACAKFASSLSRRKPDNDIDLFLSDINNYNITIKSVHDGYLVEFRPLPLNGSLLDGGEAVYHVNGMTYEVTGEKHFK